MKKTLVAIICTITMILAIPFASYAREANDTTLFINSDSTDIYSDSVRKVYDKTFSALDALGAMSAWDITGTYELSDNGLQFNTISASAISNEAQIGGKYVIRYDVVNKVGTQVRAYLNYKDANNYYYVNIAATSGNITFNKYENGSKTEIAKLKCEALKIAEGEQRFVIEVSIDNGDSVSVSVIIDGEKISIFENLTVSGTLFESGKFGVGFNYNNSKAILKSIKAYRTPYEDIANVSNTVKGKIVSYKDSGNAQVAVAFYDNGRLEDVFTKKVTLTKGFNDFSIDIKSSKNLVGKEIKYFLFDSLTNIKPLVVSSDVSSYRNEGLSDELEPYYPMASANTKTVDEMYNLIVSAEVAKNASVKETADHKAVIEMYKNAGFDISADLGNYMSSRVLRAHTPQTFSRITPKPLMGNYEQSYSIDAPWNNPIPMDNPKTEITSWQDANVNFQLTVVRPKGATSGNGLGIPYIIADENDGTELFANKYNDNDWTTTKGFVARVPENYGDMVNNISTGDRHAVFIDDTTKLGVQIWHIVPSNSEKGYDLTSGLIKDFDARSGSNTTYIDLTGIGYEGHAGVNAAGIPMDAISIKATDLDDNGEDITHALGAAFGAMMKARVYPAYDMDYGISKSEQTTGCVPYGGITQLDPTLDLEGMYANGKLSLPGYKILKAWRDYGLYNVDRSTGDAVQGHMLVYSSATADDWKDASNEKYNVPFKNGAQGFAAVEAEIKAVVAGDSFFGLDGKVPVYVTTPIVKKTSYDANDDGEISSIDADLITENIGKVITIDNEACDINKDGEITDRDAELVNRYIAGNYPHNPKMHKITARYAQNIDWKGNIRIGGEVYSTNNYGTTTSNVISTNAYVADGDYYTVTAVPSNGYVFDSWVNEELRGVKSNVAVVKATSDAYYEAKFVKAPAVKVVLEKNDDGEGSVSFSTNKKSYSKRAYGTLSDITSGNYQCAFRANADEGYVFKSWEVTADGVTKEYHSNILNTYINSDTTIKVNFKKANAFDGFTTLDTNVWKPVIDSSDKDDSLVMRPYISSGTLMFGGNAMWDIQEYVIINTSAISLGNTTLMTTVKSAAADSTGNARIVFGYKDTNNYWFVEIANKTREFMLRQKVDGAYKTHATFTPTTEDALDLTSNIEVNIMTTLEGKVSVNMYQGETVYTLVDNYDANTTITGRNGLGTSYAAIFTFDNFAMMAN